MNNTERGYIKHYVMRSIDESQPNSIFFISDYADLGSAETIRKILHEATITGVLEKAGHDKNGIPHADFRHAVGGCGAFHAVSGAT